MCVSMLMQSQKRRFNFGIDPRFVAFTGLCGAGFDNPGKCHVGRYLKSVLPYCLG